MKIFRHTHFRHEYSTDKSKDVHPARVLMLLLLTAIAAGTFLLKLPFASKQPTTLLDALLTASSALSATGISAFDTYTHWTIFGQVVILIMIELGGMGFLVLITFFNIVLGRKLGLKAASSMLSDYSSDSIGQLRELFVKIVKYSLFLQLAGAVILGITLVYRNGAYGIFMAVFTSVSAFCNAGFNVMGYNKEDVGVGFHNYSGDLFMLLPICALIVLGGLGFAVWENLLMYRSTRHFSLHTKVVLSMTAGLLVTGTVVYFIIYSIADPASGIGERILPSLLTSINARTAGMTPLPPQFQSEHGMIFTMLLMFIGAAPASTAGGIKVTTAATMIATVLCAVNNNEDPEMFGHKIKKSVVYKTLTVITLSFTTLFLFFAAAYLSRETDFSAVKIMFEVVSAFTTTGFADGLVKSSGAVTRTVLIAAMFMGRIGPVSLMMSLSMKKSRAGTAILPESNILVG